ncbi:aspartate-semialdehyde dehydrogenase [Streptantibioticus cattleyicolor]|uniref:Aspartate-semialdehyde dehydrogenase n=1 Tax=Streptantibioticus cattleyicolor (strain ATCC 35852 / DSM 46488 / JCM 4925 / NBRC 14057 / NRRL 8057) TaxID=1003195 RepID=F8JK96_STREN|nr:aspartate-semialdehyde dehydrogenase [Streptantibioticus cattleyicolor]AEW98544.1 aspartate-semialdehyde dehydrogenase [Streptantibioticus cattleyicolor NRRL 8057 = DSM 46488]CCB72399.1 Aspartate-semialdehyde dehydrogenase [Streptantibioticus cattleyicolor NRRL 8057 = DSM 46488]
MTLVTDPTAPRIALVGATGLVGNTLIQLIEERGFRYRDVHLVASARSVGRELTVDGRPYPVQNLEGFDFSQVDLAFFSAGASVSAKYAPHAVAQGALVIDNTSHFRMDPDSPLVVPQVNAHELDRRPVSGVIANPNCSTIPLVRLLQPVEARWGIRQAVVSTYQAASGRGHSGVAELREATAASLADPADPGPAEEFTPSLSFNVVPFIDRLLESGFTFEEQKMLQESRKILGLPHLDVTTTCVRVPVVNSHSEAAWIECHNPVDRAELVALLAALPEVTVHDQDTPGAFPTPRTVADRPDHVHVGRVRVAEHNPRGFWLWLVADNIRIGAALNAIQIAEALLERGTL